MRPVSGTMLRSGSTSGHTPRLRKTREDHRSHRSKLQEGGRTGHTERNGYGPAAQRGTPASRSWTTGAEERPAWLSAQLCGEERSQRLSGGRETPGHLQLSMLPPLLSLLRAPGSTQHCNAPLSPFKSTASPPPSPPSAAPQPPRQFVTTM